MDCDILNFYISVDSRGARGRDREVVMVKGAMRMMFLGFVWCQVSFELLKDGNMVRDVEYTMRM